MFRFIS